MKISSLYLLPLFSLITNFAIGQKWTQISKTEDRSRNDARYIIPDKYEVFQLNIEDFKTQIQKAPQRFQSQGAEVIISLPTPSNKFERFSIKRSDVFHPDLAKKYPGIQSYTGFSLDDPSALVKISISHKGMDAFILSSTRPTIYIDTYAHNTPGKYIVYSKHDYRGNIKEGEGHCSVEEVKDGFEGIVSNLRFGDCQLRKFRLALACTGEYAAFHGGNIPDVLAEYNRAMNRVNGIYEREFAITMEIIANTDQIIFLNGGTDPYTNDDGSAMLTQNQNTIDQIIGLANYDIGHVFSTGGGGIASLRSPCTNRRARGVTGLSNPTNDGFWVDYVAHEMGHQFGGNHTFNNSCNGNRSDNTAAEPGSGSTIMAYAGICSPNVQNNSDDYFHAISQLEVANFVVAGNGSCAEIITIDNTPPVLDDLTDNGLILPSRTPFSLTAAAEDAEDDALTFCWEQMDTEIATMPPSKDSPNGPAFRTFDPSFSPTRYFPSLSSILNGANGNQWEVLTGVDRSMDFNVTVRDNNGLGGCSDNDDLTLNFVESAGPFFVLSQNSTTTWNAGEEVTISWDVANTDMAPISCANVDIYLSLDGGLTFDILIADETPNDGEIIMDVPFHFSDKCRIMIKCSTSIFFDINNKDFTILAPFSSIISPNEIRVCPVEEAIFTLDFVVFGSDPLPVSFDLEGLPSPGTFSFSPAEAATDTQVILSIQNLQGIPPLLYDLIVKTNSDQLSQQQDIRLFIEADVNLPSVYLSPADGETGASTSPFLSWQTANGILSYEVEVSTNPNFENIIYSGQSNNSFTTVSGLLPATVYYWRVRSLSECFTPEWSGFRSFQTGQLECTVDTMEANLPISEASADMVESSIELSNPALASMVEVGLNVDHTYIGDLSAKLKGPNGYEVVLFDRPGVPGSEYGCSGDNLRLTFSDSADNLAEDLENACEGDPVAIEGQFRPLEMLQNLNGQAISGPWTLVVEDALGPDGGIFLDWNLTICSAIPVDGGVILKNQTLQMQNMLTADISNQLLEVENSDSMLTKFTLRSIPSFGQLLLFNPTTTAIQDLAIGDVFTQEDIDLNHLSYTLTDPFATDDSFLFDTEDDQNRYTANNVFNISSTIIPLAITAEISQEILCAGDSNGKITAMADGGFAPYSFSIDGTTFVESGIFTDLGPGTYTIITMDNTGTVVTSSLLTLIDPLPVILSIVTFESSIFLAATGGDGNYMFSLDGINYTSASNFELIDGQEYQVFVKDGNGCIDQSEEMTFYIITAADISSMHVACKGDSSGSIVINGVTGGLAPYSYQLDGGNITTETEFIDLGPGEYTIKIYDDSGINFTADPIIISEPTEELSLSSSVELNTITLEGNGGTPPYLYSLNGMSYGSENVFTDLVDGEYMGYILDSNNCEISEMSIIVNTFTIDPILEQMNLFPNPARNSFQIGSSIEMELNFEMIDMTGKVVKQGEISTNVSNVIESIDSGTYMIKIISRDGIKVFKLAVIK